MSDRPNANSGGAHGQGGKPDRDYTEFGFKDVHGSDELHDALDGTLDRADVRFRSRFMSDRGFRDELSAMESMLSPLKSPPRGPDMSARILGRVAAKKAFVPLSMRKLVSAGRLAAAACVLLAIGAAVAVEYARPGTFEVSPSHRAVSMVVDAASADMRSSPGLAAQLDLAHAMFAAERGNLQAVSIKVVPSAARNDQGDALIGDFDSPMPVDRIERVWVPTLGRPALDGSAKTVIRTASWRPGRP